MNNVGQIIENHNIIEQYIIMYLYLIYELIPFTKSHIKAFVRIISHNNTIINDEIDNNIYFQLYKSEFVLISKNREQI